jgi:hypothetical protein
MGNTPSPQSLLKPGETLGAPVQAPPVQAPASLLKPGETLGAPVQAPASVDNTAKPGAVSRFFSGAYHEIADPIAAAIAPPQDSTEHVVDTLVPGGLVAYRLAKNVVQATENTIKAKPAEFQQAKQDLANAIGEFHAGHYRNAIADAASTSADALGLTEPAGVGERTRELAQGTKKGADLATPLGKTAADVGMVAAGELGGEALSPEDVSATAQKLLDATKNAPEDELTMAQKAKALISKKAAARVAQPATTGALRNAASAVAKDAGVAAPDSLSAANSIEDVGDAIYGQSKGIYKQIDNATGGKFTGNEQQLRNIDKEIRMASTDEELGGLQAERAKLVQQQNDLFDQAAKNGVDETTVAAAKSTFKRSQALYDLDTLVKRATTGVPKDIAEDGSEPEMIDPAKLSKGVNSMYRSGRLQEALGEDGAKDFVNKVSQAAKSHNAALSLQKIVRRVAYSVGILEGVHYGAHFLGE